MVILVPFKREFTVRVDDKKKEYLMGEAMYYTNTSDMDFFVVDQFITFKRIG